MKALTFEIASDPETARKAWAIRKQVAKEQNVPIKFVRWRSCVRAANAGGKTGQIRDAWGYRLGSSTSKINLCLLSEDAPLVIDSEWVSSMTGIPVGKVNDHIRSLEQDGFVRNHHGFSTVKLDKRPF